MFKIKDKWGNFKTYFPKNNRQFFVQIYSESIEKFLPKVGGIGLKVFLAIESKKNWNNNSDMEITICEIMKATGLSETAVKAGLKELEELKILLD